MGLSGVGDTFGTCFGPLSRNRNLGIRLGQGEDLKDILASSTEVAGAHMRERARARASERARKIGESLKDISSTEVAGAQVCVCVCVCVCKCELPALRSQVPICVFSGASRYLLGVLKNLPDISASSPLRSKVPMRERARAREREREREYIKERKVTTTNNI
jgi:hypothetical protein